MNYGRTVHQAEMVLSHFSLVQTLPLIIGVLLHISFTNFVQKLFLVYPRLRTYPVPQYR